MKPLLSAPLTDEDIRIWDARHGGRDLNGEWHIWRVAADESDRRDAALMYWLTQFTDRHYHPDMNIPLERLLPAAHMWLMIDPEWPAGHHVINIT